MVFSKRNLLIGLIILLILIGFAAILWLSNSAYYLQFKCVKEQCNYHDDISGQGCVVNVIGKPEYHCEYFSGPCPKNKNTPCYIKENRTCPLIGACFDWNYVVQLGFAVILLICVIVLVSLCLYDLFIKRQYEEIDDQFIY